MRFCQAQNDHHGGDTGLGAFSFIELLVVLALLAILTVVLLPAFASSGPDSKVFQCQNDKRQLTIGWIMYQGDNNQTLMALAANTAGSYTAINNSFSSPNYNYMDWSAYTYVTNTTGLVGPTALMGAYVSNARVYKCPVETYQSAQNLGPRTRSVSLNGALDGGAGGGPTFLNQLAGRTYFKATKVTDLRVPGPANIFVFLDEQADSIDNMVFMNNEGYASNSEHWRNLPAGYHNGCGSFSFADGHCALHKWLVNSGPFTTVYSVHFVNSVTPAWSIPTLIKNADYEWLDNSTPYQL
jgi:type II secretory pathway pseudopilin PulG